MNYPVIQIKYDYSTPLNLLDFADSLKSINELHDGQDYELQIKDIRRGSIELDLINIDPSLLSSAEEFVTTSVQELGAKTQAEITEKSAALNELHKLQGSINRLARDLAGVAAGEGSNLEGEEAIKLIRSILKKK